MLIQQAHWIKVIYSSTRLTIHSKAMEHHGNSLPQLGPRNKNKGSPGHQPHALAGGDLQKPRSRSGQSKKQRKKAASRTAQPAVTSVMRGQVDTAGMFVFPAGGIRRFATIPAPGIISRRKNYRGSFSHPLASRAHDSTLAARLPAAAGGSGSPGTCW